METTTGKNGERAALLARLVDRMPHGVLACRLDEGGVLRLAAANGAAGRLLALDLGGRGGDEVAAVFPHGAALAPLIEAARTQAKARIELIVRPDGRAYATEVIPLGDGAIGVLFVEIEPPPPTSRRGRRVPTIPPSLAAPPTPRSPPASAAQPSPPHPPAPAPARGGHILVIDDEPLVGRMVERALARHHRVTVMTSGKDALERLAAGERFDLVLCDLMMPEMTGMDLYERVLALAAEQAERMVFLTGGAFTARARTFLTDRPYLEKPFDLRALEALVRERVG